MLEQFRGGVKFMRVDSDIASALKGEGDIECKDEIKDLFTSIEGNGKLNISFEAIKDSKIPAILNISEESRRMDEMMKLYALAENETASSLPLDTTLVINTASPVTEKLVSLIKDGSETKERFARYIYKLSIMSYRRLSADEMQSFLSDSYELLELLK